MPYYDQPGGGGDARDRITQALLAIQSPPPVTPQPPAPQMPNLPQQGGTQAATSTPGVTPQPGALGNSTVAAMTNPGGGMTSTLGQQQMAQPAPQGMPSPAQQRPPGY